MFPPITAKTPPSSAHSTSAPKIETGGKADGPEATQHASTDIEQNDEDEMYIMRGGLSEPGWVPDSDVVGRNEV